MIWPRPSDVGLWKYELTKGQYDDLMLSHHQDLALVPAYDPVGSMLGAQPWPELWCELLCILRHGHQWEFRKTARNIHLVFSILIVRLVHHREFVATVVTVLCHQVHSVIQQLAHLLLICFLGTHLGLVRLHQHPVNFSYLQMPGSVKA